MVHLVEPRRSSRSGGTSRRAERAALASAASRSASFPNARLFLGRTAEQRRFLDRARGVRLRLGRSRGGILVGLGRERFLQFQHQGFSDLEIGAALVFAIEQMPRGVREVAALQQVVVEPIGLGVVARTRKLLFCLTRQRVAGIRCASAKDASPGLPASHGRRTSPPGTRRRQAAARNPQRVWRDSDAARRFAVHRGALGDERRRSLLLALVLPGVVRALMLLAYLVEGQVPEFGVEHVLRRGRVPAAIVEC